MNSPFSSSILFYYFDDNMYLFTRINSAAHLFDDQIEAGSIARAVIFEFYQAFLWPISCHSFFSSFPRGLESETNLISKSVEKPTLSQSLINYQFSFRI